jgi:hypothetical protein
MQAEQVFAAAEVQVEQPKKQAKYFFKLKLYLYKLCLKQKMLNYK